MLRLVLARLLLQCRQLLHRHPMFDQQALVVAVQLGDLVLAHHGALLGLAQFRLDLLHLAFVASLLLFALLFDGVAVMLQGIAERAGVCLPASESARPCR